MYTDVHYFLLDNQYVVESAESLPSQLGIEKNVYCAETCQINLINKKIERGLLTLQSRRATTFSCCRSVNSCKVR